MAWIGKGFWLHAKQLLGLIVGAVDLLSHLLQIIIFQSIISRECVVASTRVSKRVIRNLVAVNDCLFPTLQPLLNPSWLYEKVTFTSSLLKRGWPVSIWLSRASSKLRLTAALYPSGQWNRSPAPPFAVWAFRENVQKTIRPMRVSMYLVPMFTPQFQSRA